MGSYTAIVDENIEIVNPEGLKSYIKAVLNEEIYKGNPEIKKYIEAITEPKFADGESIISFYGWDNWKIISYWYSEMVMVLRDLAVFINGNVELEFENNDEAGEIWFEDGNCIIKTAQLQWQYNKPEDILSNKELLEMPDKVKESLLARKI